jgi:hypothetical protein
MDKDVVTTELKEITDFLKQNGYAVEDSGREDTDRQMVINCEKIMDYNDDEGYINNGTIKIKIVYDAFDDGMGIRKRIIKRKKTTRRKRKMKK